jgi:hypothetical protein
MTATPELPQPDPALKRLDRLVGTWSMEGNLVGSVFPSTVYSNFSPQPLP